MADIKILVQKHFEVEALLDAKEKAYKNDPERLALESVDNRIKAKIVEVMNEMGVENVKTEYGTPYFSRPETFAITDPQTFIAWVVEKEAYDVLPTTIARKEAMRSVLADDADGVAPGVTVTHIRKLNIKPRN